MMVVSWKIRKLYGKYLILVLVFFLIFRFATMNDNVMTTSGTLREMIKKPNFLQYGINDVSREKIQSTTKNSDLELDIEFLFVGVKKCGSTAFKTFLNQHPEIEVYQPPTGICRHESKRIDAIKRTQSFLKTRNKTNKKMVVAKNRCFQKTKAFDRLKQPSKIIMILCDPTLRTFSDYKHSYLKKELKPFRNFEEVVPEAIRMIEAHKEDENFTDFISLFQEQEHEDYSIVAIGFYYEYLKEYFIRHKPEDILILSGAEFKQEPYLVMNQVESFLGVRHYFDKSKFIRNQANGMYCVRSLSNENVCVRPNNTEIVHPDEATMETLRELYRPYNKKLFQLLNRTFLWL